MAKKPNFEGKSVEEIIQALRADEWISNYQYHIGKEVSQGKAKNFLDKVFDENGDEEYDDHFKKLSDWLQAYGFALETSFIRLQEIANTKFVDVEDSSTTQDLFYIAWEGEQEAVEAYRAALATDAVKEHPELVYMLQEFLMDEIKHIKELADVGSQIVGKKVDLKVGSVDFDDEEKDEDGSDDNGSPEDDVDGSDDADGDADETAGDDGDSADNEGKDDASEDDDGKSGESDDDSKEDGSDDGDEEGEEGDEDEKRDENRPNAKYIPLVNDIGGEKSSKKNKKESDKDSDSDENEEDDEEESSKKKAKKEQVNEGTETQMIVEKKTHKKMGVLEKIMVKGMK